MMIKPYKLIGKSEWISTEQIRAHLNACYTVLGHMGLYPERTVNVFIVKEIPGKCMDGTSLAGTWNHVEHKIKLLDIKCPDDLLTTILHEVIHSVVMFPAETLEKCTSTLTGKLKPFVAEISAQLLDNTYRWAAFLAHTKITYKAKSGDYYDPSQYNKTGVKSKYVTAKRLRNIKNKN